MTTGAIKSLLRRIQGTYASRQGHLTFGKSFHRRSGATIFNASSIDHRAARKLLYIFRFAALKVPMRAAI
jgi:hypothetical protein